MGTSHNSDSAARVSGLTRVGSGLLSETTHFIFCRIKNCEELKEIPTNYCFSYARLKQLDKRYWTKYGMSMIDNLKIIKENGIDSFMVLENRKWTCEKCGDFICVHTWKCSRCGYELKQRVPGNE